MKQAISDRIRIIRKTFHLSQKDFGARLGVSRDVISNIEYGRVEAKDMLISHMAEVFGVNEIWIRTGSGQMLEMVRSDKLTAALEAVKRVDRDFYNMAVSIAQLKEVEPNTYAIIQKALYSLTSQQASAYEREEISEPDNQE